ncbi:MAG: FecR family protein [Gammaproteobacteria bacterium]|nr:FecR family protein [Gammaproteobacteria bacterium]
MASEPFIWNKIYPMPRDDDFNGQELPLARRQAAEWFVRLRDKPPTKEARCAFERWLAADPRNREEYQAIQGVWQELDGLRETFPVEGMAYAAAARDPGERGTTRWKAVAVAAVLVLSVLTGLGVFLYDPGSYQTAKGEQQTLRLADQSVVHLNSDSALRVELTSERRTLHLQKGEAYFEVAPDPARPFVVIAAGGAARAVGTRFGVYRHQAGVRVSVVDGRVEVAVGGGDKQLLNAGETVTYSDDGGMLSPIGNNDVGVLDWLDGRVHFEAAPLTEVVAQFNRYQEAPLHIADPRLNNLKLSGTFRIANLHTLPQLLPRMLPVSLEQTEEGVLLIRPD